MEDIIKELQKIGFTNYEAKTYIALLQQNPATGYEISKLSGVPRAKVYENITRLINDGIVLIIETEPTKYVPINPKELLKNKRADFDITLSKLNDSLLKLNKVQNLDYVWNIKGYASIMEKALQLISGANDKIMISLWYEEALFLQRELDKASNRGVDVKILLYGNVKIEGASEIYTHGGDKYKLLEKKTGRWMTLVIDGIEVLTGQATNGNEVISIWTSNPSIVFVSAQYIEHEIYIAKNFDRR